MADPAFAKLVADAVATKLAGSMAPTETKTSDAMFDAFLSRFDHMLDVDRREQKPGYVKPLTPEEVGRPPRRSGRDEAPVAAAGQGTQDVAELPAGRRSQPVLRPGAPAGPILYQAGQEINWRGPPAESFKPLNEEAVAIFAAYKRWVGEPVSIEELTRQAARRHARGVPYVPEYMQDTSGGEYYPGSPTRRCAMWLPSGRWGPSRPRSAAVSCLRPAGRRRPAGWPDLCGWVADGRRREATRNPDRVRGQSPTTTVARPSSRRRRNRSPVWAGQARRAP